MASRYSKNNKSSLKSYQMILPLLNFWIKTILKRILNKYLFSFNLGSTLILISGLSFFYEFMLFVKQIYSVLISEIFVSEDTFTLFTRSLSILILAFYLFLFYAHILNKYLRQIRFNALMISIKEKSIISKLSN